MYTLVHLGHHLHTTSSRHLICQSCLACMANMTSSMVKASKTPQESQAFLHQKMLKRNQTKWLRLQNLNDLFRKKKKTRECHPTVFSLKSVRTCVSFEFVSPIAAPQLFTPEGPSWRRHGNSAAALHQLLENHQTCAKVLCFA